MPPDLVLEILSVLSECTVSSGKFKSRLAKISQGDFNVICSEFAKHIQPDSLRDLFMSGSFAAKCHWLKTLNAAHPSPCKICSSPTKIKPDGFSATYCGVKCRSLDPIWLQKRKETCLSKYGVDNAAGAGSASRKRTCKLKYGTEFAISSDYVRNKTKSTMLKRYGVENISQHIKTSNKKAVSKMRTFIEKISEEKQITPLFDISAYDGLKNNPRLKWKCNKCDKNFFCNFENYRPHCPKCESKKSTRTLQGKFYQLLHDDLGIPCKFNCRTLIYPLELDLVFNEQKLAVEINGFYWHSINDRTEEKRTMVKQHGWKFMMFFEDEIRLKPNVVSSMIIHKLGKSPIKIHARKCEISVIDKKQAYDLTDKWHLSGAVNGSTCIGLKYNGAIVAIAIFGNKRFGKRNSGVELLRFCTRPLTAISGGHSKIISFYKNLTGTNSIITFADRRLDPSAPADSKEDKNGFVVWDNRSKKRVHRLAITKSKLAARLDNPELSKTQEQLANEAGFLKVPNLGVFKYVL